MREAIKVQLVCMLLVLMLCTNAFAAETTELSIDSSTCWLKERGVAVKKNPISIQGKNTENGCVAFITDDVFDKRFKFCVYSGFEMSQGQEAEFYGCSYSREMNSYMFRAHMNYEGLKRKPDLECRFMCYNK